MASDDRAHMVGGEDKNGDQHVFISDSLDRANARRLEMERTLTNVRTNEVLGREASRVRTEKDFDGMIADRQRWLDEIANIEASNPTVMHRVMGELQGTDEDLIRLRWNVGVVEQLLEENGIALGD